jgi:16S rRNA (uracil1498-N3)-methyltransferase
LRTTRIYFDGCIETGAIIRLTTGASHHLVRVLRHRRGANIRVFNGRGGEYLACMLDENTKHTELRIDAFIDIDTESSLQLTLLQGICRVDRMDMIVQKAVEFGVRRIVPVLCQRGSRLNSSGMAKKHERWRQIAISACEQSARTAVPKIAEVVHLQNAVAASSSQLKLLLDPATGDGLKQLGNNASSISILIGPEGGLAPDEIQAARDAGFQSLRFGPRVLRTETAGIAAISSCQLLWGDMG